MWARRSGVITKHFFVDYQDIGNALRTLSEKIGPEDEVLIADIGYSKDLIDLFLDRCGKLAPMVSWFDHHQWDREAVEKVNSAMKELVVDESLCASEIIQKRFVPDNDLARKLASLARAHDFNGEGSEQGIFDHACKIQDVITSGYPKQAIVEQLSNGILWSDSFEVAYRQYQKVKSVATRILDDTIERHHVLINGVITDVVLAFALDNLEAKDVKRHLFEKNQCDAVIVVWSDGRIAHEVISENFIAIPEKINKNFKGGGRGLVGGATYPEAVNNENRSECFKTIIKVVADGN